MTDVQFTCEIVSGNAAFADAPGAEVARILRCLADKIEAAGWDPADGYLFDNNGNKVGVYDYNPGEPEDEEDEPEDEPFTPTHVIVTDAPAAILVQAVHFDGGAVALFTQAEWRDLEHFDWALTDADDLSTLTFQDRPSEASIIPVAE